MLSANPACEATDSPTTGQYRRRVPDRVRCCLVLGTGGRGWVAPAAGSVSSLDPDVDAWLDSLMEADPDVLERIEDQIGLLRQEPIKLAVRRRQFRTRDKGFCHALTFEVERRTWIQVCPPGFDSPVAAGDIPRAGDGNRRGCAFGNAAGLARSHSLAPLLRSRVHRTRSR